MLSAIYRDPIRPIYNDRSRRPACDSLPGIGSMKAFEVDSGGLSDGQFAGLFWGKGGRLPKGGGCFCFFRLKVKVSEEFFVLCWENLEKILKLQFEVKMILDKL